LERRKRGPRQAAAFHCIVGIVDLHHHFLRTLERKIQIPRGKDDAHDLLLEPEGHSSHRFLEDRRLDRISPHPPCMPRRFRFLPVHRESPDSPQDHRHRKALPGGD